MPDAMPRICVCTPALYALLQTSLLLITTLGAAAVGGVLSTVTVFVPVTVDVTVFVWAAAVTEVIINKIAANNVFLNIKDSRID